MKLLGLIGGTGWVSTEEYYHIMNEEANRRLGGLQSLQCVLYSFNYAVIHELNEAYDSESQGALMVDAAKKLVSVGAEGIMLCANTTHQFADRVEEEVPVPLIHIATATAKQIKKQNISTVGLLGTKYTMEMDFYKNRLKHEGIQVLIPNGEERKYIHSRLIKELLKGVFSDECRAGFLKVMNRLHSEGAEGIVLGCTEFPLLIRAQDTTLPLFDTLHIHALAGVDFALGNNSS
jgi:aspartate racemase